MRWLRRLFAVPFGLVVAVTASSLFLITASVADPVMGSFAGGALWVGLWTLIDAAAAVDDPTLMIESTLADAGRLFATVLLAPPVFVALLGEAIGARRVWWYAGATGLLTGALPWLARGGTRPATPEEIRIAIILALVGTVAGLVYWLIAGRSAGPGPASTAVSGPPPLRS
jgi:hypothetical protein